MICCCPPHSFQSRRPGDEESGSYGAGRSTLRYPCRILRRMPGTAASASFTFSGSLPPAWAMCGLPPPDPPACSATPRTISPACSRLDETRSSVTTAMNEALPLKAAPRTPTPEPRLSRNPSAMLRIDPASSVSTRPATTRTPFDQFSLLHKPDGFVSRSPAAAFFQLPLEFPVAPQQLAYLVGKLLGAGAPKLRQFTCQIAVPARLLHGDVAADRLHPARPGGDTPFGNDGEGTDPAGVLHMCAPAQLDAEIPDPNDADPTVVLLSEKRLGPHLPGGVEILLEGEDLAVGANLLVDEGFHVANLLGLDRLEMGEVETQTAGGDQRTHLRHVIPQGPAQRLVQEVGGGVVAGRRGAGGCIDLGLDRPAGKLASSMQPADVHDSAARALTVFSTSTANPAPEITPRSPTWPPASA